MISSSLAILEKLSDLSGKLKSNLQKEISFTILNWIQNSQYPRFESEIEERIF